MIVSVVSCVNVEVSGGSSSSEVVDEGSDGEGEATSIVEPLENEVVGKGFDEVEEADLVGKVKRLECQIKRL